MKIYIVHIDAYDERSFHRIPDEEIKKMYEEDSTYISCYHSIEELAANWNSDEIFSPSFSYMRVTND